MLMSDRILIFTGMQCRTSARVRKGLHESKITVILSEPSKFVAPALGATINSDASRMDLLFSWTCHASFGEAIPACAILACTRCFRRQGRKTRSIIPALLRALCVLCGESPGAGQWLQLTATGCI